MLGQRWRIGERALCCFVDTFAFHHEENNSEKKCEHISLDSTVLFSLKNIHADYKYTCRLHEYGREYLPLCKVASNDV